MFTVVNPDEPTPAVVSESAVIGGSLIDEIVRDGDRQILAAQRRERAKVRSERQRRWGHTARTAA